MAYPLVNVYIANWNITILLMGKSTISMAIFNGKLLVITRGYEIEGPITWFQDIFYHTPSYPIAILKIWLGLK